MIHLHMVIFIRYSILFSLTIFVLCVFALYEKKSIIMLFIINSRRWLAIAFRHLFFCAFVFNFIFFYLPLSLCYNPYIMRCFFFYLPFTKHNLTTLKRISMASFIFFPIPYPYYCWYTTFLFSNSLSRFR